MKKEKYERRKKRKRKILKEEKEKEERKREGSMIRSVTLHHIRWWEASSASVYGPVAGPDTLRAFIGRGRGGGPSPEHSPSSGVRWRLTVLVGGGGPGGV